MIACIKGVHGTDHRLAVGRDNCSSRVKSAAALQALSEYALRMKNGARNNLNVIISENVESFYVKEDNQFLVQSQELVTSPNNGLTVNLTASGRGCVLAQFISR